MIRRLFPDPIAAKVPEVIFLFWVVKILTTAGGEATSDFLKTLGEHPGRGTEVALFLIGLVLQFATRRYRAFAYWVLAYSIAIFGTGVSDFLHLDVGIPYAGTTAAVGGRAGCDLLVWYRLEGTLSIHSITTQRREMFYWATVFATFALGTALGDLTATPLGLGYLASGIIFGASSWSRPSPGGSSASTAWSRSGAHTSSLVRSAPPSPTTSAKHPESAG